MAKDLLVEFGLKYFKINEQQLLQKGKIRETLMKQENVNKLSFAPFSGLSGGKDAKDINSYCRGGLNLYKLLFCPYFLLIFLYSSAAYSYLDNFTSRSDLCK